MENKEKIRIRYYECNMTRMEHIAAWLFFSAVIAVILYIYYRSLLLLIIVGPLIAVFQETNYSKSVMRKRKSKLRLQFKEFLEIISISVSGGSGRSMENAVIDALKELQMIYNRKSDIVREISLIVSDYEQAGIPMSDGFAELGERSEIDDIVSFAAVYKTIEGKTSNFGYIISQTREIIKEKVEIAMEIETTITSSKAETYTMLVLPLALIVMMSSMGSGILDTLFTTFSGRIAATVGVVCTFVSFVIAARAVEIEV